METEYIKWVGFGLSFAGAFVFSLLFMTLGSLSKISLSRIIEERGRDSRLQVIGIYDELLISVEIMRSLFVIAFLVYFFIIFPPLKLWPLWLFFLSFAIYLIFFDIFPRLFLSLAGRKKILYLFLPSFGFLYFLFKPVRFFAKRRAESPVTDIPHETTDEEIQAFIEEAKEEGIIEKDEGVLIKSIVEFGDTIVREIMTPRVDMICIRKDTTIHKLRDLVVKEKHSRIPVYKDRIDNIEGIVIAKDLLELSEDKHRNSSIEPLIRPVYFVPESMKVSELLKEFQERKQKLAIVVDEHGGVSGLVTMEDLVEEIVGEIQDEYDKDKNYFEEKGPLDYVVSGEADVEELEDLFDMDLAEENFITVGGMITHYLGRLPLKGELVEIKNLSMEILDADQKRIKKLRIKKADGQDKSEQ